VWFRADTHTIWSSWFLFDLLGVRCLLPAVCLSLVR
jgi:hypothetical protein